MVSSSNGKAHIPALSLGVVVIKDVLGDGQWQSCLEEDAVVVATPVRCRKESPAEAVHQKAPQATATAENILYLLGCCAGCPSMSNLREINEKERTA
ncbi:unnamed protein product [Echinostoma caproni]|uniref:Uncharacterized protein n=1 Tax=Echinostoma caproni TaxID=27848 RepID=A0A182ZZD0_9TREM|nr:unnamed protein product [Echinostoma caproni]